METSQSPQPAQQPASAPGAKQSNAFAVTALVLGIVAFCFGWTGPFGLILGIAAVVFGIIALVKKQSKGMGITGLALGGVALLTALIITSLGVALFGAAGQAANQISNEQKTLDSSKKDFAKGETASFGDISVKVDTVTQPWQSTDGFSTPKTGYEYVYVKLNIKNTSDQDVSINPYDFKLNDAGVVSNYEIATTPTPLSAVELKSGSAVDGDLVFQVKQGATDLKLQYDTYSSKAFKEVSYTVAL